MMVRSCVSLLLLTVLWACGSDTGTDPDPDAETGSVTVTAETTGTDLDSEYGVTIGSLSGTVPANGSATIANVPVGAATVQLTGVATNCAVTGSTSLSVTVAASATVTAEFTVVCEAIVVVDVSSTIADAIASMEEAMFIGLNIGSVPELDDFSFEESNTLFLTALSAAPTNETALFGAAVTGIFLLEDNTDVRALAEDWDAWLEDDTTPSPVATLLGPAVSAIRDPITLPLGFSTGTIEQVAYSGMAAFELANGPALTHDPPPSVTEHQAVLRDVVRPALIESLGHLFEITSSSFTFTVTEAMQGELEIDADPLELDYTEILTMQAGLQAALAAVDIATAYIFTPNPLDAQGFVDAMTPGSTFLTLATGGADALGDALERLQSAGTLLLSAIDELKAETDDQTDDIIKIDPITFDDLTFESAQELEDARASVQDILDALSSPTVITVDGGPPDGFSFMLDARQFFIDPIADFKLLLAPYVVLTADEGGEMVGLFRWTALNLDEWMLPDPTFSGILPGMTTTSDLFDLDFDEFFFEFSLTMGYYDLTTVDGNDCQAIIAGGGDGCAVGGDFYYGGNISLDGYDGQPQVSIFLGGSSGPTNYVDATIFSSGSYDVVDIGGDTYTVTMDTELDDGSGTPFMLTGTFLDMPGFTNTDEFGRYRGGSSITVLHLGSIWVFEKQ